MLEKKKERKPASNLCSERKKNNKEHRYPDPHPVRRSHSLARHPDPPRRDSLSRPADEIASFQPNNRQLPR